MSNKLFKPPSLLASKPKVHKVPKVKGFSPAAQEMLDDGILEYKNGAVRPRNHKIEQSPEAKDAREFRLRKVVDDKTGKDMVHLVDKSGMWETHLEMTDFWQEFLGDRGQAYVLGIPLVGEEASLGILKVLDNRVW